MGEVPAWPVPHDPKVEVDRAIWYELGLNRPYLTLAMHHGTAILLMQNKALVHGYEHQHQLDCRSEYRA